MMKPVKNLIISDLMLLFFLSTAYAHDDFAVISLNDNQNSTYGINLVSYSANTWTYRVSELGGRDLTHWSLAIDSCLPYIQAFSADAQLGTDETMADFIGIQWPLSSHFTNGSFSFTLNEHYPAQLTPVLVKAGALYKSHFIIAPACSNR